MMIAIFMIPIIIFLAYRLFPESSPIAKAKTLVTNQNCLECHSAFPPRPTISASSDEFQHPVYETEINDLNAYFEAIRINISSDERIVRYSNKLIQGEALARKYHCFICHGLFGQGGEENKGSLKGYIPGWFGRDFDVLTNNGDTDAIREWITQGVYGEIINEPVLGEIATYYIDKQEINMLSLSTLSEEEITKLVEYVLKIRSFGAMDREDIISYENQSKQ